MAGDRGHRRRARLVLLPAGLGGPRLARPAGRRGRACAAAGATRTGCCVGETLDFWRVEEIEPRRAAAAARRDAAARAWPGWSCGVEADGDGRRRRTGSGRCSTRAACSGTPTGGRSRRSTASSSAGWPATSPPPPSSSSPTRGTPTSSLIAARLLQGLRSGHARACLIRSRASVLVDDRRRVAELRRARPRAAATARARRLSSSAGAAPRRTAARTLPRGSCRRACSTTL